MNLRLLQSSFTAGELSPKMLGQCDFAQYQFGCETLENFFVWPQGMASRRPGTKFIAAGGVQATPIRLIPFEFSTTQAYILEMGHEYFRFYMTQGQIETSPGNPYELVHGYDSADLFEIQYNQSADVMFLAHPDYPPKKLSRTSHTAWTIEDIVFVDGPYMAQETATTITPSGTTGSVTLTATTDIFNVDHIGSFWRLLHGSTWGNAKITAFGDARTVTATVVTSFGSTAASDAYREGCWSIYRGFPSVVGFYENRLFWAASKHQPQTLWGSKTGDYYTHTPGTADDDPINITLNSDYVNAIKWMSGGKVLLVGTTRGQWHISATGTNTALTPADIKAVQETGLTSSAIWTRCDHTVLFWQQFGRNLMEIVYSLESDSYVATPLTVMAEHIGLSPIKEMAYLQEPLGSIWCVRTDGQIAILTYERQHKVVAWTRMVTDGYFESIARIPGATRDEIWVLVKRTIGGATKRYIELLENIENYENDVEDFFYVDSGLIYDSTPVTTISGLTHLEGKTVAVLADGAVHADCVVASGAITLTRASSTVQVGLPYTSTMHPVRAEIKYQGGTIQDRRQKVTTISPQFYKSYGGKFGEDLTAMENFLFRQMGALMDVHLTMYTGFKRVQFPGSFNRDGQFYITQSYPLPMNILSIATRVEID